MKNQMKHVRSMCPAADFVFPRTMNSNTVLSITRGSIIVRGVGRFCVRRGDYHRDVRPVI